MAADYLNTLSLVRKAVSLGTPIVEAWDAVVDHISADVGPELTLQLRELDIAEDLERLDAWLLKLLIADPPPRAIRGLCFGLFHPGSVAEGRVSCDFYLTGSPQFEKEGDAWIADTSYQAQTHPHSRILDTLYQVSADDRLEGQPAVEHVCLWFGLLAIAELCRRHSATILGKASRVGVATGFDGGDLITLGVHSKSGFVPIPLEKPNRRPRRRKLLPGDYFHIEGGRDVKMCKCTNKSLSRNLFRRFSTIEPISLTARVNRDWPDQRGTFGSLEPFGVDFLTASVAKLIETTFPNEVQFHELKIEGSSEEWRIMQVLHCVTCFNREVSDRQQRVTLWKEAAAGHNIFFIDQYYTCDAVMISRAAAQLMLDHGLTGAEFIPVAVV